MSTMAKELLRDKITANLQSIVLERFLKLFDFTIENHLIDFKIRLKQI